MENTKKQTPLHAAIAHGNYTSLQVLCEHVQREHDDPYLASLLGPNPEGKKTRLSPIQLAIKKDKFRVLDILMSYDLGDLMSTELQCALTK